MPAQIPKEATDFFGNLLLPYIPDMVYYFTYLIFLYAHVIKYKFWGKTALKHWEYMYL